MTDTWPRPHCCIHTARLLPLRPCPSPLAHALDLVAMEVQQGRLHPKEGEGGCTGGRHAGKPSGQLGRLAGRCGLSSTTARCRADPQALLGCSPAPALVGVAPGRGVIMWAPARRWGDRPSSKAARPSAPTPTSGDQLPSAQVVARSPGAGEHLLSFKRIDARLFLTATMCRRLRPRRCPRSGPRAARQMGRWGVSR